MTDEKLTETEARAYWERLHLDAAEDLEAVCSPWASATRNRFFDRLQRDAIVKVLDHRGLANQGELVLEVGSGRGRWLLLLGDRGAHASGVDLSSEAVAHCLEQGLDAIVAGADELPFEDASFDLVVSITVMIHLSPRLQRLAAREMLRVCRPGGHILLLEGTNPGDRAAHVWARRPSSWVALFSDAQLVSVTPHHFVPAIRLLDRVPVRRLPWSLGTWVESAVMLGSLPLERLLVAMSGNRPSRACLQAVMVLRRHNG